MGLILGLVLAALVWAALWRTRRLGRAGLQLVGAALLIGLSGYALQGRTGLVGSPAAARKKQPLPPAMPIELAAQFYGRFNAATPWLAMANSYMERGDGPGAVGILTGALKAQPRSSELWIALGNAIVGQNGGRSTPASDLAYERSATLVPTHPAPPFFYGLSLLQQGKLDPALIEWRKALALTPVRASWYDALAERIVLIERMKTDSRSEAEVAGQVGLR